MAFNDLLIHTCTIQRATVTQDAYGNDAKTFSNWAVLVRCRVIQSSQRVVNSEGAQHPTITTYSLLLGPDVDVQDGDQITSMAYPDDTVLTGTFEVESISPQFDGDGLHHYELSLQRVT